MSVYIDKEVTLTAHGDESQRIRDLMKQAAIEFEGERADVNFSRLIVRSQGRSKYGRRLVMSFSRRRYAR